MLFLFQGGYPVIKDLVSKILTKVRMNLEFTALHFCVPIILCVMCYTNWDFFFSFLNQVLLPKNILIVFLKKPQPLLGFEPRTLALAVNALTTEPSHDLDRQMALKLACR